MGCSVSLDTLKNMFKINVSCKEIINIYCIKRNSPIRLLTNKQQELCCVLPEKKNIFMCAD